MVPEKLCSYLEVQNELTILCFLDLTYKKNSSTLLKTAPCFCKRIFANVIQWLRYSFQNIAKPRY